MSTPSAQYDVIVIGAGPAGYVAAIRAAQLGLRTACIDRWCDAAGRAAPGGTCLNVGCIPSKALLDSSEQYHKIHHKFAAHGISVKDPRMDIAKMLTRKDKIIASFTAGITALFKANKVDFHHGHGRLLSTGGDGKVPGPNATPSTCQVQVLDTKTGKPGPTLHSVNVILASGSEPIALPSVSFDGQRIVDSAGALAFTEVPRRLAIIGAGVIGLELGSVWRRVGAEVVILEALPTLLATADHLVAREAAKQFKSQGLDIRLSARVESAKNAGKSVHITWKDSTGKSHQQDADKLIVAVGRRPCTDNLLAEGCGVATDERGFIVVDENCRTPAANVYAIGDAVRGPMLAHKGSEEGVAVAERIAGGGGHVNYDTVPWVIYTSPEIAWVGQTEQQLKEAGTSFRAGSFPFAAIGRARAMEDIAGFVRILAHQETDRILGVHIIGPHASELISEAVLAMEYQASAEDLARTMHAHPTLSEAVHEAALAVAGRAIHKPN